jgi:hydrogenase maturation protein HypF
MAASGFNSPPTTSCGRLFDAAAALLGVCDLNTYEAQAAFELTDLVVSGIDDAYPFAVREAGGRETGGAGQAGRASGAGEILAGEAIAALAADVARGTSAGIIATRFHNTVAGMMVEAAARAAARRGLRRVVLGGGTFQNPYLFLRVRDALRRRRLDVYWHHRVPAGDGGLALGQAAVALCVLGRGGRWLDDGAVAR